MAGQEEEDGGAGAKHPSWRGSWAYAGPKNSGLQALYGCTCSLRQWKMKLHSL